MPPHIRTEIKQGTLPQYFLRSRYLLCMINILGQAHCCVVPCQSRFCWLTVPSEGKLLLRNHIWKVAGKHWKLREICYEQVASGKSVPWQSTDRQRWLRTICKEADHFNVFLTRNLLSLWHFQDTSPMSSFPLPAPITPSGLLRRVLQLVKQGQLAGDMPNWSSPPLIHVS